MAIITSDILTKLSVTSGAAGNSLTQSNKDLSLGKYISTTLWAGGALHDLFDRVTGDQAQAGDTSYRCIFIHNNHSTLTYQGVVVYISAEVSGGSVIAIGVDPTAASLVGASSAQAIQITDAKVAPANVTFTAPTIKASGISVGDLAPGYCRAIWLRRTTAALTGAKTNDGATLTISGDTDA